MTPDRPGEILNEELRTVLVVDDEPGMRYATRRILSPQYEVIEAGSGEEALDMIGEQHFNVALVDFRLPGISGLELLAAIKVVSPSTDVVIMTGSAKDPDEALLGSIRRKAFFFLRKPFSASILETLVDRITETQILEERLQQHARQLEDDLESARVFQQALLPPHEWSGNRIEVAALYVPSARLSGDLIDYWPLPGGGTALLAADVMGHGASASMITGVVKTQLHMLTAQERDPGRVLHLLDLALHNLTRDRFLTAFLLIDDLTAGEIRYCGAGHPPGILRTPDGKILPIESEGIPLNLPLPDHPERAGSTLARQEGTRIFLSTDGFGDATSPEDIHLSETPGYRRLIEDCLRVRPAEARDRLEEALLDHTQRMPQNDDRAFLVAELL
ncbi:MAG: response regulator [Candidatus Eisenbacteria bacterium]|nr:response regulator [Candidatus Eisenbacteria bacterium]